MSQEKVKFNFLTVIPHSEFKRLNLCRANLKLKLKMKMKMKMKIFAINRLLSMVYIISINVSLD